MSQIGKRLFALERRIGLGAVDGPQEPPEGWIARMRLRMAVQSQRSEILKSGKDADLVDLLHNVDRDYQGASSRRVPAAARKAWFVSAVKQLSELRGRAITDAAAEEMVGSMASASTGISVERLLKGMTGSQRRGTGR